MQGTFLSLFTRRSHKDRGVALAWWGTSFRGPMPFITWRDVDLFTDRSYENEGRKGKARCETACFEQSSAFTKIYLCLSFSFCKRTLCSPVSLWSSSGHVYTSVLIPNRSAKHSMFESREKKNWKRVKLRMLWSAVLVDGCSVQDYFSANDLFEHLFGHLSTTRARTWFFNRSRVVASIFLFLRFGHIAYVEYSLD